MLDHFVILTKGGLVLFSHSIAKLKGHPVDDMLRTFLLESRTGTENSCSIDQYTVQWRLHNDLDLIFVVVYQKIVQLSYVPELLEVMVHRFNEQYKTTHAQFLKDTSVTFDGLGDLFDKVVRTLEHKIEMERQDRRPREYDGNKKGNKKKVDVEENETEPESAQESETSHDSDEDVDEQTRIARNVARLNASRNASKKPLTASAPPSSKPVKVKREGTKGPNKAEKVALELNRDGERRNEGPISRGHIDLDEWKHQGIDLDLLEKPEEVEQKQGGLFGFLKDKVSALTGNKPLEEKDLEPIITQFREHFIRKNVAAEIAEKLCDSVQSSLLGKKLSTLQIFGIVRSAVEEALIQILTPKRQIDILHGVQEAKKAGRPYVMVFVGVNGVGKSTTLSKVCAYLLDRQFSVMMAACDTFRAGAVEQLLVHSNRLGVELYEKGYRIEPTQVAMDAVKSAGQNGKDVVLIDTAGRMQDNEPLMAALSKLVNTVRPDLVVFVGEALVGNNAVDQLVRYNQALMDHARSTVNPRLIDGIILTKFDTIDDKVGAAISMVYTTGQPIIFLGVGQQYTDLRRMNVKVVCEALLRDM
eukprot:TRINITY_DN3185_c0_g1_i1.p1 TRINITY_DN3185_c0_g1~~TRINITY_DN3185_c0_g1_i1.p1  ORF type:complete len:586 (+),score=163.11 TRINITY_DN3185_c0_g1_i1:96-1853(+)